MDAFLVLQPGLRRALLVMQLLWLALVAPAQAQTNSSDPVDFHTRFGTTVKFDMPNRWEAALEYELRMVENSSTYRGSFITGELARGLTDYLTVSGNYRLAMVDEGVFHRFAAGAQASAEVREVELSFRPMFQYQRQNFSDEDQATDEEALLRTRLRAELALARRLDAYASTEPFFTFAAGEHPIDNIRNTVGLEVEYLRGKTLNLYYIYRPDYAKRYNRTFHTLGVDLEFGMDLFKGGE